MGRESLDRAEVYHVIDVDGFALPLWGTMRPGSHQVGSAQFNMQRAFNSLTLVRSDDGLSGPAPITLTGDVKCDDEDALEAELREVRDHLARGAYLVRAARSAYTIERAVLESAPKEADSSAASVTVLIAGTELVFHGIDGTEVVF